MKALKFNTKSWHYRFITSMTPYQPYKGPDLCTYVKYFMLACVLGTIASAVLLLFAAIIVDMVLAIGFSVFYGMWVVGPLAFFGFLASGVTITGVLISRLIEFVSRRRMEKLIREWDKETPTDGFLINAYKSWKDKYCAKIEFLDESSTTSYDH